MSKIIYIAGPMSGLPDYNRDAFANAWAFLTVRHPDAGIINPAKNFARNDNLSYATYLRLSIHQLLIADTVFVLPGYENSTGAKLEIEIAKILGLEIIYHEQP